MDWKSIYQSKRMTVNEAIALIHNGDKVVTGFACGEPLGIERALVEQYRNFQDVEIISMAHLRGSPLDGAGNGRALSPELSVCLCR